MLLICFKDFQNSIRRRKIFSFLKKMRIIFKSIGKITSSTRIIVDRFSYSISKVISCPITIKNTVFLMFLDMVLISSTILDIILAYNLTSDG